ncbi:MAG: orotidine 5-phosphate decarboxylase [Pseudomonadota bacterium]
MQTVPLQLSDVIYNAATQAFEALVTVHDPRGGRSYACAIDAPISMTFENAADGLARQAVRRHVRGRSDAIHMPSATPPLRGRRLTRRRRVAVADLHHGRTAA